MSGNNVSATMFPSLARPLNLIKFAYFSQELREWLNLRSPTSDGSQNSANESSLMCNTTKAYMSHDMVSINTSLLAHNHEIKIKSSLCFLDVTSNCAKLPKSHLSFFVALKYKRKNPGNIHNTRVNTPRVD